MSFSYGLASKNHLAGVVKELRDVFMSAIKISNIQIIDGVRTFAEQERNLRTGASTTMNSKHLPQADAGNLSKAVDAVVYPVDWNALEAGFVAVKRIDPGLKVLEHFHMLGILKGIAHERGLKVRQGIDWNSDGDFAHQTFNDMPHTEVL